MKKLNLAVEELSVESFETAAAHRERGTVRGHWSFAGTCDVATCQDGGTCAATCKCGTDDPRYCV